MQGHIGPRCTAGLLAAMPCTGLYKRAVSSSGAEQGFYLLKNHNKSQHFHQLGTLEEGFPSAHGCLGQPSHYPIPEVGTWPKLQLPTLVLENQPFRVFSFSWEVSSCLN